MMKNELDFDYFRSRYLKSDRKSKSKLLDELCDMYGYNRKYLLQVIHFLAGKEAEPRGRKRQYKVEELLEPLKRIWLATDQMCGKRLNVAIKLWLPFYDEELSSEVKRQLLKISPATIDRLLKPYRVKYKRRGLTGTKPGYLLKNQIPIKTDHWDVSRPGFLEADTVAHCGNSIAGDYVWSISLPIFCCVGRRFERPGIRGLMGLLPR